MKAVLMLVLLDPWCCFVAYVSLLLHQCNFFCQDERGFTDSKCCSDSQQTYTGKYNVIEGGMPF